MLYHEKQVAALCGVHCINTLLQGPFFSELDLAQIGHELDQLERQVLGEGEGLEGANLDDSGMFSIQVLTKALQVWGLQAIPTDNEELRAAGFDPQQEQAFICNLQEHWFTIREIQGEWWNMNSLYPAPEQLSNFYLTAYLDSLKQQGYTIFVVRGNLQAAAATAAAGELEGPGRWWSADEARAAHKEAQQSRQLGRAKNAMEDALARAAAGGGSISLRTAGKRPAASQLEDDEDADLAAAIAASMQDPAAAGPSAAGAAAAVAGSSGHAGSYAEAARRAHNSGTADASIPMQGDYLDDDDDPELAAALAASLQDQQQQSEQQPQQQPPQQQLEQLMPVPEEPAEGAPGALTVAFRLPSGARLTRRFLSSDVVGALQAYVMQQLLASGEAQPQQRVVLSLQFPKRVLDAADTQLNAAGVEDRSVLSVQLS